jgi:predicted polyphosphate/ATP-dependent NAD kinase
MQKRSMKKIGLIVNPLAGIGGKVGLKGSDGIDTVKKAFSLGAEILSPKRATEALDFLSGEKDRFELVTWSGVMGAEEAEMAGYTPTVLGSIRSEGTTAEDTRRAAREMMEFGVELIVFAGGDGTARDIYEAINTDIPVLGIPAGVKIHSSVYAVNPRRAAELIKAFLDDKAPTQEMEVMDIDEELFRQGRVSARLYGYMKVPFERRFLQGAKTPSQDLGGNIERLAAAVVERIQGEEDYFILGPGSTIKAIGDQLNVDKTLLGVDLYHQGALIAKDMNENQLLEQIVGKSVKIVVTVIGGQGYIFGRGNQQISARVIRAVGKQNIWVVASSDKLLSLKGSLLVDTGDMECDQYLTGYMRVITGMSEETVWRVEA